MLTFERIEALAARFTGVEAGTPYGTPALRAAGRSLLRMHDEEDAVVMLFRSEAVQQSLVANDPIGFFITDHCRGYAAVLMRPTVAEETFLDLLEAGWRQIARKRDLKSFVAVG